MRKSVLDSGQPLYPDLMLVICYLEITIMVLSFIEKNISIWLCKIQEHLDQSMEDGNSKDVAYIQRFMGELSRCGNQFADDLVNAKEIFQHKFPAE